MEATNLVSDDMLMQAAELRAGGAKWEAVARALDRALSTVEAWPRRFKERWRAAMRVAEKQAIGEARAESVHVLRKQLRSEDEKSAREAARTLTNLHSKESAAEPDDEPASPAAVNPLLAAFVNGKTDEQLLELADALHADAPSLRRILCEPVAAESTPLPE